MKRLLEKKGPLVSSDIWQEVERVKERNRQLHLKIGAERRESIEKISELNDQLAAQKTQRDKLRSELADREEKLAELRSQLAIERADREEVEGQLKELQENSDAGFDCASKAGEVVSQLRKEFGNALPKGITVKKVQKILEGGDN